MMTEPVTTYTEAIGPIRERVGAVLKIRYGDFDSLCSFPDGLSGKVFGPAQVKRLGIEKFFDAVRGVGLRIRFEEDPEQTARMLERIAENYLPRQSHQARPNNHSRLSNKIIAEVLDCLANRRGGLAMLNEAVKQARSKRERASDFSAYPENVSRIGSVPATRPPEVRGAAPHHCSAADGREANAA
jgi:hypothetical protein